MTRVYSAGRAVVWCGGSYESGELWVVEKPV